MLQHTSCVVLDLIAAGRLRARPLVGAVLYLTSNQDAGCRIRIHNISMRRYPVPEHCSDWFA